MNENLGIAPLVLPKNFVKRKKAIMAWFRQTDQALCNHVTNGGLRLEMAQTYYKMKVEGNEDLSHDDKQVLANESKLWKMCL